LALQAEVAVDGRVGRLDDVVGSGWLIITAIDSSEELLSHSQAAFWIAIGGLTLRLGSEDGPVQDIHGSYRDYLQALGAKALLIRPDFYIYAALSSLNDIAAAPERHLIHRSDHGYIGRVSHDPCESPLGMQSTFTQKRLQIHTGAKTTPRACHHDRADLAIGRSDLDRLSKRDRELLVNGIQHLGTVQCDQRDVAAPPVDDDLSYGFRLLQLRLPNLWTCRSKRQATHFQFRANPQPWRAFPTETARADFSLSDR